MRKWTLFLSGYLCLCLLAACGASGGETAAPAEAASVTENVCTAEQPEGTADFRVVDGSSVADLLLAKEDGADGDVYRLAGFHGEITQDGQSMPLADMVFVPGDLVEVTYGGVLETYPGQLTGVTAIDIRTEGFDDRCRLYLDVLEDLWNVDPGLNGDDLTYIGVDLSATSLTTAEQSAVAWRFAEKHGGGLVQGTYAQLVEQGYITGTALDPADARNYQSDVKFWQWTDGCLFTITEKPSAGAYTLMTVTFDAEKWRSALGAYFFNDCTSVQSVNGQWGGYQAASEAIA